MLTNKKRKQIIAGLEALWVPVIATKGDDKDEDD